MGREYAEDLTPVVAMNVFQARYLCDWKNLHAPFLRELGVTHAVPGKVSNAPTSRRLFTEVNGGLRRLDWCPPGIGLFDGLYPWFLSRKIDFFLPDDMAKELHNLISGDAWIVTSEKCFRDDEERRQSVSESGIFGPKPDVAQMAFLIAATVFRYRTVPFASPGVFDLRYVRTSTVLKDGRCVVMAFVSDRALVFAAFPIHYSAPNILVMDAFIFQ